MADATSIAACAWVSHNDASLWTSKVRINCPGVSGDEMTGFLVHDCFFNRSSICLAVSTSVEKFVFVLVTSLIPIGFPWGGHPLRTIDSILYPSCIRNWRSSRNFFSISKTFLSFLFCLSFGLVRSTAICTSLSDRAIVYCFSSTRPCKWGSTKGIIWTIRSLAVQGVLEILTMKLPLSPLGKRVKPICGERRTKVKITLMSGKKILKRLFL